MGENGAGKSTLMKILAGIQQQDDGDILLDGQKVKFNSPKESLNSGIAMIHQELNPVLDMSIAENLFLGREFRIKGTVLLDYKKINQEAKKLLDKVGLKLSPRTKMFKLTVAQMQMVEIAKAIDYNSEVIIMDEPTSAITDREVETLFAMISKLREEGHCIIYITHKMDEVFRIADEITVFRDGKHVGTYLATEIDSEILIKKMVDRELTEIFPNKNYVTKEVKLSVRNLARKNKFQDVSFDVRQGEILGLAGLMGAGRTEIVESIFGITKLDNGEIYIDGKKVNIKNPNDAIKNNIGLVTEDRKFSGLVLPLTVKENMVLPSVKRFSKFKLITNPKKERSETEKYIKDSRIKTPGMNQVVKFLSGGNQQKVVLGKWLMTEPQILIFDEPTRGIDIGAKSEIYKLINELAEHGNTIIFISSEMQEILGMCDRIVVFHEGRLSGELSREDATQEKLLKLATGTN
jgi:inositol transport system ATP-binding protein